MNAFTRRLALMLGVSVLAGCGARTETPAEAPPAGVDTVAQGPTLAAPVSAAPVWDEATAVGAVVAQRPQSARVFELVGIDYCCGGKQTLAEAAQANEIDVHRLLEVLRLTADGGAGAESRDWTTAPLDELIDHICDTHHAFLRRELPRLTGIVDTVTRVHGDNHPELIEVQLIFTSLQDAIEPHLLDEEKRVFPAIRAGAATAPSELTRQLAALESDHDEVGAALHRLRELTAGFRKPADACALYTQMLAGLVALERDLHTHVHLENEVLIPRARAAAKGS